MPEVSPEQLETPVAGKKVLEIFTEEFEIGSRKIYLETGKMARYTNGAVLLKMDNTSVLSTVTSSRGNSVQDFLPLTVDYQEKHFAQSVIPPTSMRREGPPKERELLCGRLIDRPIRPLFPSGFYHEVQVIASVLSSDRTQDPDVMAANATSAALMLSDIPWAGPIGVIRIGRLCGQFIVNPSMDELKSSDLNLVYACTKEKTLMMDVQAGEISEKDLGAALRMAHPEAVKYLEPQVSLAAKVGKQKREYSLSMFSEKMKEKIRGLAEAPIEAVFTNSSYSKSERGEALDKITQDVKKKLEEELDPESLKGLPKTVDTIRKEVVRRRIMSEGLRVDGRHLDEVRPIYCEAGPLPLLHGSSFFSRGATEVLCTLTLGAPDEAQRLSSVVGPPTKHFMLHYSFPPFCTNEPGKLVGFNRREVGHGSLAEKALQAVLPSEDIFPYTIRVNSEVMASDGSTSMATVCAGSMALMDGDVPVRGHVAGLSIGLVSDSDPSTGEIKDYKILTDILGLEDHLGDMDFKVAGTRNGITAIQLDMKLPGIPLDIICECLESARKGRLQILDHMEQEISGPRARDNRNSPQLVTLKYSNDAIRRIIGPLGALKRKIEEETGARISVDDGKLIVVARNQYAMEKAQEKIEFIVGREILVGESYKGVVTSIKEYGAFVELNGGQQGLLHISELSHEPVSRVSDVISVGQQLRLMCIGQDVRGNIKLSLKATSPVSGSKPDDAVEKNETLMEANPSLYSAPTDEVKMEGENQDSLNDQPLGNKMKSGNSSSASSVFLIRSVAECDAEERSDGLNLLNRSNRTSKTDDKSKKPLPQVNLVETPLDSAATSKNSKKCKTDESSVKSISIDGDNSNHLKTNTKKADKKVKDHMGAKQLKIGTEVTAKVHEIRAHGLVLDLGGGIHGMYRFETDGRTDFVVGEALLVRCSSFSGKGIPVLSLAEDKSFGS